MKKITKLLCLLLAPALLASFVGCSHESDGEILADNGAVIEFHQSFYDEPKLEDSSGIWVYLTEALKLSGKTLISSTVSSLVQSGVSSLLTELGYDTRSIEQKQLDQIDTKLSELKGTVDQGFKNVMRKQVQIRNETAMNELLAKIDEVKDPVTVLLNTLNDLAKKELSGEYSEDELQQQRLTFAKSCDSLRFNKLSANTVWYSTRMLASAILSPYPTNSSLGLWDLYEDTFGALETWDYMTVQPRTEFICYLAFLINGLAQLSKEFLLRDVAVGQLVFRDEAEDDVLQEDGGSLFPVAPCGHAVADGSASPLSVGVLSFHTVPLCRDDLGGGEGFIGDKAAAVMEKAG